MIDHFGINCADFTKSKDFYDSVRGVVGFTRQMDFGLAIGYGRDGHPYFWIAEFCCVPRSRRRARTGEAPPMDFRIDSLIGQLSREVTPSTTLAKATTSSITVRIDGRGTLARSRARTMCLTPAGVLIGNP